MEISDMSIRYLETDAGNFNQRDLREFCVACLNTHKMCLIQSKKIKRALNNDFILSTANNRGKLSFEVQESYYKKYV